MEGWLQGSDCGRPWGPLDILQGEAPRGDIYQGHHLLQGTGESRGGDWEATGGGWWVRGPLWRPSVWPWDASRAVGSPLREPACWECLSDLPSLSELLLQNCPVTPWTSLSRSLALLYLVALFISASN